MVKAVIFDMDGLIIDSEPIQSKSYEAVLKEYGKKPQYHDNGLIQVLGVHAPGNWEIIKEKHQLEAPTTELLEKKTQAYADLIGGELEPMPGLVEILEYLKSNSIPMAVASSSDLTLIKTILSKLNVIQYFQAIVSGEEVQRGKPHPDIFLETAKQLGIDPEYCLVLEDAETGVIAGKAAGMKVIAVKNSYTGNQDHSKADIVTDSLLNVNEKLLKTLN